MRPIFPWVSTTLKGSPHFPPTRDTAKDARCIAYWKYVRWQYHASMAERKAKSSISSKSIRESWAI